MKKTNLLRFAFALSALAVCVSANANVYVQGDLGISKLKLKGSEGSESKTKFSPSLSVGYDFGAFRAALDYTHYAKSTFSEYERVVDGNYIYEANDEGKWKFDSIGISGFYDFDLNSSVTPFVGARLSLNKAKVTYTSTDTTTTLGQTFVVRDSESFSKTKVGYGVIAGADIKLTDNLSAVGSVEYNYLGKFDDLKVHQYGAKIGLRYSF